MNSLQGYLLVASPHLDEPTFARTVILMLQHTEQGALGVVLNRPIGQTIRNLWQQVSGQPCEVDLPVNMGGPVSGPLLAVHCLKPLAELEVPGGVYVAATKNKLDQLVHQEEPFRIFIGHAGWTPGQLENEIAQGVWMVTPATFELVFGEHDDLWQKAMRNVATGFYRDVLRIKHIPADPALN